MSTKLVEMFNKMYQDTDLTDCTIIVDTIKFECHKIVLAIDSDFFRCMFLSNFRESSSSEVHLQDVTPVIFQIFREYSYTYDKNVLNNYDMQTLISLYECGNMWMAPSIVKDCATILVTRAKNMVLADLAVFFELGHKHNNTILINGITDIIRSTSWTTFNGNNSTFLLNHDIFKKFISYFPNSNTDKITENYLAFNRILEKNPVNENANGNLKKTKNEHFNQEKSK